MSHLSLMPKEILSCREQKLQTKITEFVTEFLPQILKYSKSEDRMMYWQIKFPMNK